MIDVCVCGGAYVCACVWCVFFCVWRGCKLLLPVPGLAGGNVSVVWEWNVLLSYRRQSCWTVEIRDWAISCCMYSKCVYVYFAGIFILYNGYICCFYACISN